VNILKYYQFSSAVYSRKLLLAQAPQLLHPLQVRRDPAGGAYFAKLPCPQGNRFVEERPFRMTQPILRLPALKAQSRKMRLTGCALQRPLRLRFSGMSKRA
ncbi:MAG: hypothetical protein II863_09710, partial [Kiritimatiellae bacterium]|nr:hypothetical protein [Kiritimatiellia bacterium]